jgi:antitoxin (DNA-binding transcriptional repressor) of toxin-antitoxin stability system
MSLTISIEQASTQLEGLVRALGPNDEIVLTDNNKPVARIVSDRPSTTSRQAGSCQGMLEIIDDSDDDVLEIFKDYMP